MNIPEAAAIDAMTDQQVDAALAEAGIDMGPAFERLRAMVATRKELESLKNENAQYEASLRAIAQARCFSECESFYPTKGAVITVMDALILEARAALNGGVVPKRDS